MHSSPTGLLLPQSRYRFRVIVDHLLIPQSIRSCTADYARKRVLLDVQDAAMPDISQWIVQVIDDGLPSLTVETLDDKSEAVRTVVNFVTGVVDRHSVIYDYASDGVVVHTLEFQFDDVRIEWPIGK